MDNQHKSFIQNLLNPLTLEELEKLLDEIVGTYGFTYWHLLQRQALGARHEPYRTWLKQRDISENDPLFDEFSEMVSDAYQEYLEDENKQSMVDFWHYKEKKNRFARINWKKASRLRFNYVTMRMPFISNNEFVLLFAGDNMRATEEIVEKIVSAYLIGWRSINHIHDNESHKNIKLGKRERQVLSWTSQGKTSFEIATILNLSEHTINNYVTNAANKLGANNRVHTVCRAMILGLI